LTTPAAGSEPTSPPRAGLVELVSTCFVGDLDDGSDALVEHAASGRGGYACLCNVHVLTEALHDAELQTILRSAAIRFPDGEPVAWLLRRTGHGRARRIGGPDLLPRVVDRGRAVGLRHFLAGSTEENLARVADALRGHFAGAEIVGTQALPYAHEPPVDERLLEQAREARAQVLWVSLGAPKQERWMVRAAPLLPDVMLAGVGAAFDFVAGTKPRAPALMQRAGLEWLHRMASEPRRLTSRYIRSNSEFVGRTAWELARRRLRAGRREGA